MSEQLCHPCLGFGPSMLFGNFGHQNMPRVPPRQNRMTTGKQKQNYSKRELHGIVFLGDRLDPHHSKKFVLMQEIKELFVLLPQAW